ncbi:MAG: SDR family oxidoreductase [Desulfamplus sp.]|nr:SDR family oxidoreductase [Desulfamplus sp.]
MKIAITGALGHIGSHMIRILPDNLVDLEILMIDNMRTQRYPSLFNLPSKAKYKFIEADILNIDLNSCFDGVDIVLHLAAITDAAGSFQNKKEVEHVNFNSTLRVAEACCKTGSSMIHLSSTSVYGTQNQIVDEECTQEELKPQSPYAETKLKEEKYLAQMAETENLSFITCRFGTICGVSPGMRFHTAVNKFCWQAVLGQPLTVWRTALHQKRPYLTLIEAGEAIKFIIKNRLFDHGIYNILTENLTVDSIIQCIRKYIPILSIQYVDTEIMNQLSYEVLNHKFMNKGFICREKIEHCIANTIKILKNAGSQQ